MATCQKYDGDVFKKQRHPCGGIPSDERKLNSYEPPKDLCQFPPKPYYSYYRNPLPAGAVESSSPTVLVPECWTWSNEQLEQFLVDIGYGRYRTLFQEQSLSGKDLTTLTAHDFRRMGIRDWGDCVGLWKRIRCHQQTGRQAEVKREMLGGLPFPFRPAMYFEGPADWAHIADRIHYEPVTPTRDRVWRTLYSTTGDRFFYVDSNRPVPTI